MHNPSAKNAKNMSLFQALLAVLLMAICTKSEKALKLGLITPPDGQFGFERVAAASTMALEQAKLDGYLTDVNVRLVDPLFKVGTILKSPYSQYVKAIELNG